MWEGEAARPTPIPDSTFAALLEPVRGARREVPWPGQPAGARSLDPTSHVSTTNQRSGSDGPRRDLVPVPPNHQRTDHK
jgi:hypothetical protein